MFLRRAVFLLACAALATAQTPDRNRHVVVISLDGFPAYALQDPSLPLPVMRKLIREGGVADAMKPINPTVTWPNHTAIITGVNAATHGVIYNGMPVRGAEGKPLRVEPWVPKKELVQARTVYDAAHDAGLTTAEMDWVAIYQPGTINWSFAEVPSPDGPLEKEMVAQGAITAAELSAFPKAPITFRDDLWVRAAVHVIEKHKPNLLMMHLLTTDSVQHANGARSLAGNTALILADRQIQRVLDAIDRAGIAKQTTVLVVSDHGFKTYQHRIRLNALLRQKGLLREKDGQPDCDAWAVAEGGTAMVYVNRESAREATVKAMREAVGTVPGIAKIIMPDEYAEYGYPAVKPGGRMSDMVLAATPGYAFDATTTGEVVVDVPAGSTPGNHGYLNSDPDLNAILVAWGAGIQPGSHVGVVPNLGVAPTIAKLLGLNFPGTPIGELLKK